MTQITSRELMAKAAELMEQAKALRKKEAAAIIQEIVSQLNEYSISLSELKAAGYLHFEHKSTPPKGNILAKDGRQAVAKKYSNPKDKTLQWSGRGIKPKWVKDHISTGGSLDDLLIK